VGAGTGRLPRHRTRPARLLHRRPPAEVGDYATEHLLHDVVALADSMDMETFDLVGHDWGGMLAWIVASRHPGRVRTLTVVSTPHPLALHEALRGADPTQAAYGASMDAFRTAEVPERLLLGADGAGAGLATLLAETGLDDEDARMYVAALTEPGALTAALNWYRAMDGSALSGLNPVCVPTLYVWSTGDAAFGWAAAQNTPSCVQGPYTFEVLDNVSHWIPEMAPGAVEPPDPAPQGPLRADPGRANHPAVAPARMAA
jgi:pimeloyl-ACP methyl ester carboxylesterase